MTTLELLIRGRDRIAQGWTQRAFARDANGRITDSEDTNAVCWCALGAINNKTAGFDALDLSQSILGWNDYPERTQADVLALFDAAIAQVQARAT